MRYDNIVYNCNLKLTGMRHARTVLPTPQDDEGRLRHPDPNESPEPLPHDGAAVALDEGNGREDRGCDHHAGTLSI